MVAWGFLVTLLCNHPAPLSGMHFAATLGVCDDALESNAHPTRVVTDTDSAMEQRVEGPDERA